MEDAQALKLSSCRHGERDSMEEEENSSELRCPETAGDRGEVWRRRSVRVVTGEGRG